MKKLSVILILVIASLLFFTTSRGTSLSSSPSSSPGDICKKFLKYTEKGNFDAVIALYSKEITDEDKDDIIDMLEDGQEGMMEEGGIKTIEIIEENIIEAGDIATVKLKIIYVNEKEETLAFKLFMEDDKWKLSME